MGSSRKINCDQGHESRQFQNIGKITQWDRHSHLATHPPYNFGAFYSEVQIWLKVPSRKCSHILALPHTEWRLYKAFSVWPHVKICCSKFFISKIAVVIIPRTLRRLTKIRMSPKLTRKPVILLCVDNKKWLRTNCASRLIYCVVRCYVRD